jgi:TRAP-type mannitol/chloroaromatic compound transport system permease small subunit
LSNAATVGIQSGRLTQAQQLYGYFFQAVFMLNWLKGFCGAIDRSNEVVGRMVSWVTLLLVLVVFVDVVMRYLFKTSFVLTQELEWHLFAFIFLIGAGYTLLHDGHVRVDIIYQRLGVKGRAWINLIGVIFFLIPGCYLVISTSWHFVSNSFSMLEGSPDPGGIPYRFIVKGTMTVGYVLLLLQGLSMGAHALLQILGEEPVEEEKA